MISNVLVAALACATSVSAHGYVSRVVANGQTYGGYNPSIAPWQPDQVRNFCSIIISRSSVADFKLGQCLVAQLGY